MKLTDRTTVFILVLGLLTLLLGFYIGHGSAGPALNSFIRTRQRLYLLNALLIVPAITYVTCRLMYLKKKGT